MHGRVIAAKHNNKLLIVCHHDGFSIVEMSGIYADIGDAVHGCFGLCGKCAIDNTSTGRRKINAVVHGTFKNLESALHSM